MNRFMAAGLALLGFSTVVLGVLAAVNREFVGDGGAEAAAAWFTLATVIAATGAGLYARRAAVATLQQRQHSTSPAFVELLPSGTLPSDVAGLGSAKEPVEVSLGQSSAGHAQDGAVLVKIEDEQSKALWVVNWERLRIGQDDWPELSRTVGDLRKVVVQRSDDLLVFSAPLTNTGSGVAVIDGTSIKLWVADGRDPRLFRARVNRARVPPGGTVRLEALIRDADESPRKSAQIEFAFTSLYFGERVCVDLTVEEDRGDTERWYVTEIAHRRLD